MTTPLETLRFELLTRYPTWRADMSLVGEGLDFRVFHAIHPVWGDVSIKAPRTRFISNENDDHIDARNLLRQEATLNGFFADHGIPTPRAFDLHVDGTATDYLIGAYVQHDQSTPSPRACGALLARMHAIAPPANLKCVAEIEDTLSKTIATLIVRRSRVVERLAGLTFAVPSESEICDVLDKNDGHRFSKWSCTWTFDLPTFSHAVATSQASSIGEMPWSEILPWKQRGSPSTACGATTSARAMDPTHCSSAQHP